MSRVLRSRVKTEEAPPPLPKKNQEPPPPPTTNNNATKERKRRRKRRSSSTGSISASEDNDDIFQLNNNHTTGRPFEIVGDLPCSIDPPQYNSALTCPLSVKDSGVLYTSLLNSRRTWIRGEMFDLYWSRPNRGSGSANGTPGDNNPPRQNNIDNKNMDESNNGITLLIKDKMQKMSDCEMIAGPHSFPVRLFILKDEDIEKRWQEEQDSKKTEREEKRKLEVERKQQRIEERKRQQLERQQKKELKMKKKLEMDLLKQKRKDELKALKEQEKLNKKDKQLPRAGLPTDSVATFSASTKKKVPSIDTQPSTDLDIEKKHVPVLASQSLVSDEKIHKPSVNDPKMIANLNLMAKKDPELNRLMSIVATRRATLREIKKFRKFIIMASEMPPPPGWIPPEGWENTVYKDPVGSPQNSSDGSDNEDSVRPKRLPLDLTNLPKDDKGIFERNKDKADAENENKNCPEKAVKNVETPNTKKKCNTAMLPTHSSQEYDKCTVSDEKHDQGNKMVTEVEGKNELDNGTLIENGETNKENDENISSENEVSEKEISGVTEEATESKPITNKNTTPSTEATGMEEASLVGVTNPTIKKEEKGKTSSNPTPIKMRMSLYEKDPNLFINLSLMAKTDPTLRYLMYVAATDKPFDDQRIKLREYITRARAKSLPEGWTLSKTKKYVVLIATATKDNETNINQKIEAPPVNMQDTTNGNINMTDEPKVGSIEKVVLDREQDKFIRDVVKKDSTFKGEKTGSRPKKYRKRRQSMTLSENGEKLTGFQQKYVKESEIIIEYLEYIHARYILPHDAVIEYLESTKEYIVSWIVIHNKKDILKVCKKRKETIDEYLIREDYPIAPLFSSMTIRLVGIEDKFKPILMNSVNPIDQVTKKMSRILDIGTRLSKYNLWYQLDGYDDSDLAESLRAELNEYEHSLRTKRHRRSAGD
ncbi:Swc3p NDAI_0H02670 [Naumovozyma dairenensis CBS 421]|uniref:SWR1-complex protein 3 n=1 Tax=Naumovozyma dairenensis (strain ATCC 10597 / BCRC 20456 / CBS 421 / NBRC 0211 / NRRL Y-12639) TaxID=1071378 RepID=G0WF80_NAUDC|nr:hypothetical protein NDAI_0H02670 [Naumovozyma dairenensis CBS 421]CCD26441.1 hypothetical protein NDAI_0H02670 [Naumovozyma dairenensis CBS 421]